MASNTSYRRDFATCLCTVLACAATATAQTTLYVDDDASGANDGSSWTDAYTDLQDALDAAVASAGTVTKIRVGAGVYSPDRGAGDRTATFQLVNGLALRGGYAGVGQPDPDLRDFVAYETTLSGDLAGDDGPDFANNYENTYHVVTGDGTDATAVLDGFTITAGNADGPAAPHDAGGGMYNDGSSPTVTNCTFSGNWGTHGGGMYNVTGSSATLTNCTFSGNSASFGGGMNNWYSSSPTLTNCTFSGNSAGSYGGGIHDYQSSPTLTNCTFSGNSASQGGGMYNNFSSNPTLTNCTFSGNSVGRGGGMYNTNSSPTLTNCTFSGNSASYGGGMYNWYSSSLTLTNCTFSGNSASSYGGGIYSYQGSPTVTNCIFWGNTAPNGPQIYDDASASPTVTYSSIEGGYPGEGNIDADPLFADADGPDDVFGTEDDDLHLLLGSPCINGGDDYAVPGGVVTDFEGDDRIQQCRVDMGVDETPHMGPLRDCNTNGTPDECDIDSGTSWDLDGNNVPDECQDCQPNGWPDFIDLQYGVSQDCNSNNVPDECDTSDGTSLDCQGDAVPDECQLAGNDCNSNGLPDDCDPDYDTDGIPDACDGDVDGDGVPNGTDVCQFSPLGEPANPYGGPMGDLDDDCDVDLDDYFYFEICLSLSGPGEHPGFQDCVDVFDFDADTDVDLNDFAAMQTTLGSP